MNDNPRPKWDFVSGAGAGDAGPALFFSDRAAIRLDGRNYPLKKVGPAPEGPAPFCPQGIWG
jgi:hypothetical protein